MTDIVTPEQLQNASLDATALQTFINGSDSEDVITRLSEQYPTLAKAIKLLMETGGWNFYSTEAELLAVVPSVTPSVAYAADTKKLYKYSIETGETVASWHDEGLSQLELAKNYTDSRFNNEVMQNEYMFVVQDKNGKYAPVLDNLGQTVTTKNGETKPTVQTGEYTHEESGVLGLLDNNLLLDVVLNANSEMIRATTEGSMYTASSAGMYRYVGEKYRHEFVGFIKNETPVFVRIDADEKMTEVITREGSHFYAIDGVLTRIGGEKRDPENTGLYETTSEISVFGQPTKISYDLDPNIIYFLLINGQSTAYGSSLGKNDTQPIGFPSFTVEDDPLVAGSPIYAEHALMLNSNDNPRHWSAHATDFTSLKESKSDITGAFDTIASSIVNHTISAIDQLAGLKITMCAAVCAEGGKRYDSLKRGSPSYKNSMNAIQQAHRIAQKNGKRLIVLSVWVQGNSDDDFATNMSVTLRKRQLSQRIRNLNDDIKNITGQKERVLHFDTQVNSHFYDAGENKENSDPDFYDPIKIASIEFDGVEDNRLAMPMYQIPRSGNSYNQVHQSNVGNAIHGQAIARAIVNEIFGQGQVAFKPTDSPVKWLSSTEILVSFDVPVRPIVIDTSNEIVRSTGLGKGLGFHFDDHTLNPPSIDAVSVYDSTTLKITLSTQPNSRQCRLSYAMKLFIDIENPVGVYEGPEYGRRGCVHDSCEHVNLYTKSNDYNWLNAFTINFNF